MKRLYFITIILSAITLSSVFWCQEKYGIPGDSDNDPNKISDMENYFNPKECTHALIDQSNGDSRELPDHCLQ
jgi:hypothetical protein